MSPGPKLLWPPLSQVGALLSSKHKAWNNLKCSFSDLLKINCSGYQNLHRHLCRCIYTIPCPQPSTSQFGTWSQNKISSFLIKTKERIPHQITGRQMWSEPQQLTSDEESVLSKSTLPLSSFKREALGWLSSLLCRCDSLLMWFSAMGLLFKNGWTWHLHAKTVPCLPPLSEHGTEGNPDGANLLIELQIFLHSVSCHSANDSPARWTPWWLGEKCYCTACLQWCFIIVAETQCSQSFAVKDTSEPQVCLIVVQSESVHVLLLCMLVHMCIKVAIVVGVVPWSVKCLPAKHGNLSLIPNTHLKRRGGTCLWF